MNRVLLSLLLGLFSFGFLGCGDDGGGTAGPLRLDPQNPVVRVGMDVTLTAKQDSKAISGGTWTTSDATIATVTGSANGTATVHGVAPGEATIKVMLGTESAQVTVMVSEAALTGVTVTPATPTIALGTTTQLTATAMFEDGSTKDVSTMATWSSGSTTIATVDGDGTVTSVAKGTGTITATLADKSGSATVTVTDAALTSIEVTPASPTLSDGQTQQMTATGHFTDDSTQNITASVMWMSATPAKATVSATGLVTAVDPGTSVVTASMGTISGMTTVTVTAAALTSIVVTPANPSLADGLTQQMTATGHYTDGTMQNLTAQVTWSSGTTAKATISTSGLVTAVDPGTSVITATMGTVSGMTTVTVTAAALTSIVVTPANPMITDGSTQQMTATGHFTDSSTQNLTTTVTWSSATPAKATISTGGLVTAVDPGTSVITATSGTISGMTTVTVTMAALVSIDVTPANPTIPDGRTQQMTATGHYTDASTQNLTTMVTWSSATPAKATISTGGLVTAVDPGTSVITATMGTISGMTTVTVGPPALVSIEVTPANPMLVNGDMQQMTATGHYSDNSTQNLTATVTWSSDTPATATISAAGLLSTVAPGTTIITATLGAISGQTTVTVTASALVSIELTPADPSLADGLTQQMTATGHYSDTTTQNLTSQVTWTSGTPATATISATGLVTAVDPGTSLLTATFGAISGTTTVTVTPAELLSIEVTPANPTLFVNEMQQMLATGTYTDGATPDLTAMVTWTSGTPATASIAPGGLAWAHAAGTSEITATMGTISGSTTMTVAVQVPVVTAMTPADGSTNQSPTTTISVTFDIAMNAISLTRQSVAGPCTGSFQVSSDDFASCVGLSGLTMNATDTTVSTTTVPALANGTTYKIRVTTDVQNASGTPLAADVTQATGFTTSTGATCATGLVISQVYGAGGNNGAVYKADFVELHNPTAGPISLNGLSVQYASSAGTTWNNKTNLPNVTLQAGGYFLIQMSSNGSNGADLPTPDHTASPMIAMNGTDAKVALVNGTTALTGSCPTTGVLDFAGYGSANCFEGAATIPTLSPTTAAIRGNNGCNDTNQNRSDFTVATPTPRNSSAANDKLCSCAVNETGLASELDYCSLLGPTSISTQSGMTTEVVQGKVYEMTVTEPAGGDPGLRAEMGYGPTTSNPQNQAGWSWFAMTHDSQVGNDDVYSAAFVAPTVTSTSGYWYTTRFSLDGINWTYCDLDGAGRNDPLHAFDPAKLGFMVVAP